MLHYDYNRIEDMLLDAKPTPHERNPLFFRFFFKPGHPNSERLKLWFEEHNVKFTVFEQNRDEDMNDACVDFANDPPMAVLFKLTFG
jgi:hypothetical protein